MSQVLSAHCLVGLCPLSLQLVSLVSVGEAYRGERQRTAPSFLPPCLIIPLLQKNSPSPPRVVLSLLSCPYIALGLSSLDPPAWTLPGPALCSGLGLCPLSPEAPACCPVPSLAVPRALGEWAPPQSGRPPRSPGSRWAPPHGLLDLTAEDAGLGGQSLWREHQGAEWGQHRTLHPSPLPFPDCLLVEANAVSQPLICLPHTLGLSPHRWLSK